MSNKPDTEITPSKKEISKADELVKGSDAELKEEELKRVSGGGDNTIGAGTQGAGAGKIK